MAEPIDKDTRGPVNLRIKFRSESLQQFIERYGVDVSRGGIFIRTREPLPVGTRLKLDFQLVDTAPLFQGDGTVVWIREHDASRAGVTPGMGVRFDRLTPESQTTLDTILEEKIRLQQSGVAPGSIAKAGAGMAVRRPSGAFATIEAAPGRPAAPPPIPIDLKLAGPSAAPPPPSAHPATIGAAPASPMPASSTRSGPLAASNAASGASNSIFNRPRTTSGLRTVPVPSALFEPPTADDIDKALSALEEKGGPAPALPVAPIVIPRTDSKSLGDDEPTKVFDGSVEKEFSAHDAVTGPASVIPENGVPIDAEGESDETQRRSVDPNSGKVTLEGGAEGKGPPPPPASLDAPLASLVDSGAAPPAKPPAPPLTKPSATGPASAAVPIKITTDRPAATESGRFRSDTRYKRKRGNTLPIALGVLLVGGAVAAGGYYMKLQRDKRSADAVAAAAASPPIGAGQEITAPGTAQQGAPGTEAAPGATGAVANPPEKALPEAPAKTAAPKPEEAAPKVEAKVEAKAEAKVETKTEKTKAEKASASTDSEKPSSRRRKKESASAGAETAAPVAAKPAEAAAEKKPAGEEAKPAETGEKKPAEAAKPAEGEKTEKPVEAAAEKKPAEAAPSAPPSLKITSNPAGADVVIDGVPVGTTPFSSKDIDPAGTHAISVKKDGYESHERMISGSDWSRGKGGAQSLKFNVKLKKVGGEAKPADTGEKKPPDVEILTPSEP